MCNLQSVLLHMSFLNLGYTYYVVYGLIKTTSLQAMEVLRDDGTQMRRQRER